MVASSGIYQEMIMKRALRDRTLVLNDYVETESMYQMAYYMDRIKNLDDENNLDKKDRKIWIEISSGGGSCYSGLFLISKIRKFIEEYGYEIICTCNEIAASMAFMILISCSQRRMYRYSSVMFHQPLSGSYGYEKMGDTQDRLEELKSIWETMKDIAVEHTKMTEEMCESIKHSKTDRWFNAKEAIEFGIIDYIV